MEPPTKPKNITISKPCVNLNLTLSRQFCGRLHYDSMKTLKLASSVLLLHLSILSANAQQGVNDISFGKGLMNYVAADSSFSVKFAPRMQVRYYGSSDFSDSQLGAIGHDFLIRRSRFKFDGWAYHPSIKYKMEFGLTNNDISGASEFTKGAPRLILDAVLKWGFAPNWELWAGQTKLPGNIERVISSANLQFVDRSMLNSKFNIDRDMGIQLRHKSKFGGIVTKEKFAISQGEGRNITVGNIGGLQYTARFEALPFGEFNKKGDYKGSSTVRESTPKLLVAYTFDHNSKAVKTRSNMGSYMYLQDGGLYETNITTHFVDIAFKYQGLSVMSEWSLRSAANPTAVNADGTETGDIVSVGQAFNLAVGQFISEKIEIAARYTSINYDPITGIDNPTQYTVGINKFIVGHKLKVQTDLSYTTKGGEADGLMFRTGFELHF